MTSSYTQSTASADTQSASHVISFVLGAVRRRVLLIIGCCVLAAVIALTLSLLATKMYSATASLLFREPGFTSELFGSNSSSGTGSSSEREAATNISLVKLQAVDDLTAERLGGLFSSSDIRHKISINSPNKSEVVSITAIDSDPSEARRLANTFATTYVTFRRRADRVKVAHARRLVETRLMHLSPSEKNTPIGRALANQVSRLQTLQALQTGNAELVQRADLPTHPSSPRPFRNTLGAAFVGLLLGFAVALLLERLDRRLRRLDEFEEAFDMPILTAVRDAKALSSESELLGRDGAAAIPEAQAFQMLRARLRYFNVDREVKVVLVTSAAPGDGKSTTALETAATATVSGVKALLIEAEFHRSTVAKRCGVKPQPGLAELLTHQTPLDQVMQEISVAARPDRSITLNVITGGAKPPNPSELLESDQMHQLIDSVREQFELIVIDTPPVLVVPDAIPLIKLVDGVIVVGSLDKTTRDEARGLREQLQRLDAPVLGVVANRVRRRRGSAGYGYYYGDDYSADPTPVSSIEV